EFLARLTDAQFDMLAAASHERSKTLDEPARANRFFILPDDAIRYEDSKPVRKAMRKGREHLVALRPILAGLPDFEVPTLEAAIKQYAETHAEGKLGDVAQPLRIAVSGSTISPPIFDTLAILGRESVLR